MKPDSNPSSLLQEDATNALLFGILFQFSSASIEDTLSNPFHLAYAQSCLQSLFEIIYGFSPATAGKTVATEIALYFHCPKALSISIGDALYVAIMLAQDTTPFGMLRSTTTLMGKTIGYKLGFWAEKRLFSLRDAIQENLSTLSPT